MRDHTRLKVFELADQLALISICRESGQFPSRELYGLQSQVRRAAVSIAANIVEGSARNTEAEYLSSWTSLMARRENCNTKLVCAVD